MVRNQKLTLTVAMVVLGMVGAACGTSEPEASSTRDAEVEQATDTNALSLGIRPSESEPNNLTRFTRSAPSTTADTFEPVISSETETTASRQSSSISTNPPNARQATSTPIPTVRRPVTTPVTNPAPPRATERPPEQIGTSAPQSAPTTPKVSPEETRTTIPEIITPNPEIPYTAPYQNIPPRTRVVCGPYSYQHPDCLPG